MYVTRNTPPPRNPLHRRSLESGLVPLGGSHPQLLPRVAPRLYTCPLNTGPHDIYRRGPAVSLPEPLYYVDALPLLSRLASPAFPTPDCNRGNDIIAQPRHVPHVQDGAASGRAGRLARA